MRIKLGTLTLEEYVDKNYDRLYDHYLNSGEMPYGVAKARTGDPYTWIMEQVEKDQE